MLDPEIYARSSPTAPGSQPHASLSSHAGSPTPSITVQWRAAVFDAARFAPCASYEVEVARAPGGGAAPIRQSCGAKVNECALPGAVPDTIVPGAPVKTCCLQPAHVQAQLICSADLIWRRQKPEINTVSACHAKHTLVCAWRLQVLRDASDRRISDQ